MDLRKRLASLSGDEAKRLLAAIADDIPEAGRLLAAMLDQPGVRLPGSKRLDGRARAAKGEIEVDDKTLAEIEKLAG